MKKRVLAFLMAGVLTGTMVFAGCGGGTAATSESAPAAEETEETTSETEEEEVVEESATEETTEETTGEAGDLVDTSMFKKEGPYKIGFSNVSVVNTFREQMVKELEYAASQMDDVELWVTDAGGDTSKQVSDIQDLISRGVDALLVAPGSTTATNNVTKQAIEMGIPVIVFNSEVDDPDAYTSYCGTSAVDFGYVIGQWLLNELDGKGKIIVLNGIAGAGVGEMRYEGFEKALAELPDGGANIEILGTYYAEWAYDLGKQATEQALAAYPEIDGVWSQGGAMTQGAMEAFQADGRPLVPMTGEDANGFLKMWKEAQADGFRAIAASDAAWAGTVALEYALKALHGEPIEKIHYIPVPTITDEDLDEYVKPQYSDSYWCNSKLPEEVADQFYLES